MYQIVIIEDDPMVSSINSALVNEHPGLSVVASFNNGKDAFDWLTTHTVDLLIIDYYMPQMDGFELLSRLRSEGNCADVIMVTAANDPESIEQLLALGITDYLTKPFTKDRFHQALNKFLDRKRILEQQSLTQNDLDRLLSGDVKPIDYSVKGLQPETAERLLAYMKLQSGEFITCDRIADDTGFSKVTVRRYMNYFITQGQISSRIDYSTGGRPSILYQYQQTF